jgi:hypothetical protein
MHFLHRSLNGLLYQIAFTQRRQPLISLLRRLTYGSNGLPRALLQRLDMRLNIPSRLLGLARQRTHLVGHHGKTATALARPRRLDGRVECQQVGLLGDAMDHRQHHLDLLTLPRQALNHRSAGFDAQHPLLD